MNRNQTVVIIAAGVCALAGSLLAGAMGLEGWARAITAGLAAGLGTLVASAVWRK